MSAPTFHHVADALVMMCASALHTVHWCVGGSEGGAREKVVWALEALPLVVSRCGGDDDDGLDDDDNNEEGETIKNAM